MLAAVPNIQQGRNEERKRQRGNKRKQANDRKKSERLKWNDEEIARQAERLNKRRWTTK